jgi:putative ABC transport system permease protein
MPHEGMPIGRRIIFANSDVEAIDRLPGIDKITGRFLIGGNRQSSVQSRVGNQVASFDVRSVHPDHLYLENTIMVAGRFLNPIDIEDRRKVCVIGEPVATFLFGTTDDVIGRWIEINRIPFQVVGLFTDEGGEGEREKIYIPITTSQVAFNGADRVHMTMFTMRPDITVAESQRAADAAVAALAAAHHFSPEDTQAVRVRNNVEQFENFLQIFVGIRVFVVFMGICSLVAGVIGVSNIMMIVVRERTREIGVRKALGARPSHIVMSIVQESVFITTVAGYLGLVAGVGALTLIDSLIPPTDMFAHPEVDLKVALGATLLLVVAGALAGLFPARAAARVNPIKALRDG